MSQKLNVITQNEGNLVVAFSEDVEIFENSFVDNVEGREYLLADFSVYSDVEVPGGVQENIYMYTPEDGFQIAFSSLDILKARMKIMENDLDSQRFAVMANSAYTRFTEERAGIESSLEQLSNDSLTTEERVELLEAIVCDLYEALVAIGG